MKTKLQFPLHQRGGGPKLTGEPETIYVDAQLLNDLGEWLGSLKDKVGHDEGDQTGSQDCFLIPDHQQLNRIMATLRRRQKQPLARPPPSSKKFLFGKQQQKLLKQKAALRQKLLHGSAKRPFSLLRERSLEGYRRDWGEPAARPTAAAAPSLMGDLLAAPGVGPTAPYRGGQTQVLGTCVDLLSSCWKRARKIAQQNSR